MNWNRFLAGIVSTVLLLIVFGICSATETNVFSKRAAQIELTGRIQLQYRTSSAEDAPSSTFENRRTRITPSIKINDWLHGKVQYDMGGGKAKLQDGYVQLDFAPEFKVKLGQYKKPFSRLELYSTKYYLVVERGVRIDGLAKTGLIDILGLYKGRDIGASVLGAVETGDIKLEYIVGVFNGNGQNKTDDNDSKAVGFRGNARIGKDLQVGFNVATLKSAEDDNLKGFGGDVEYGNRKQGLHILAEVDLGDNPKGGDKSFLGFQGILAYRHLLNREKLHSIEPAFRIDFADPDTDTEEDAALLITPGLNLYLHKSVRWMFNLDIVSYQAEGMDTEFSLKSQTQILF